MVKKVLDKSKICDILIKQSVNGCLNGPVVQLVRTPACHAGGREFEPHPGRHNEKNRSKNGFFSFCVLTEKPAQSRLKNCP